MKKNYLFLVFFLCASVVFSQEYRGQKASEIFSGADMVYYNNNASFPSYIRLSNTTLYSRDEFLDRLKKETLQNKHLSFRLLKAEVDNLGYMHSEYQQYIDSIPVEWAIFKLHENNHKIQSFSGKFWTDIPELSKPVLTSKQALQEALNIHHAEKYMWEDPAEELLLKRMKKDLSATYFPKPQLVVYETNQMTALAYKLTIYSKKPLAKKDYYMNATDGKLINTINDIETADTQGTAITRYSGQQTITADSYNGSFRLQETGRGNGIETLNMQMGSDYASAVDFTDADNYWNNVNANQDEVATDAQWATEKYYDYLLQAFGRNSIDNNGFALYNYVHTDLTAFGMSNNVNAFWDGQRMTFGDGNSTYSPLTTVDITCHEITHGLTENTAGLVYQDESGAMNEGFSDIFGTILEFYAKPSTANWTIGEDIGTPFRSLENPNAYGDPNTYHGNYWDYNNEVHQNSTVLSHWFYLVCQGGSGTNDIGSTYLVNGIGISDAAQIAFRTLTIYLPPSATYNDARFYSIIAAFDLYGACSGAVETVTNAMYAVGIGSQYQPNVVADFSTPLTTTCQPPFTVQFQNQSMNGLSFLWNFGDGNTSTDINPTHTYTNYGNFDVTLTVNGGSCGSDTLLKTAYISVNAQNPCVVIMPLNGTGTTLTSCQGTLYDGGGPSGNYSDNSDAYITIAPTGATSVSLNFISFDVEPGTQSGICDYDYLEIFDGPNASSTLLGQFCNTTGAPGTITSTGNALTILLHSDAGLNKAGFEATWVCEILNVPPVANFTVVPVNECSGLMSFIDNSIHAPTAWLWNFGDGNTSTLQNPVHEYLNNGNYNVTLIASNSFGSDTLVHSNACSIVRPDLPVTYPDSVCINQSAMLISAGSGQQVWYSLPTDTVPLFIGDTLNTPLLSQTTTYWVQNAFLNPAQYVGNILSSTNGGYFTNTNQHYLVFDCFTACKLVSVEVNASSSGNRTITLDNIQGNTLETRTVNIPQGVTRIPLNMDLPVQSNLHLTGPGSPNLWRNDAGCTYPYDISGVISIKSSSAQTNPTSYYYFFYNWEIKLPDCYSAKVPVMAVVSNCNLINSHSLQAVSFFPNPAGEQLFINLANNGKLKALSIKDIAGRIIPVNITVSNSNLVQINVSSLANGMYFFECQVDEIIYTSKVIIHH
jgi:Zn-dependent metalloprotease